MTPTRARDLKTGDLIRLTDEQASKVTSIKFSEDEMIVGGRYSKTAMALIVETEAATFQIHPDECVGRLSG